ncbi:DUF943 family protein [Erwinia billingiae]|uniref:DUF943 family protein n=1 Tax=Erwinia billingiae TaxID=182337 RepID=UPI0032095953
MKKVIISFSVLLVFVYSLRDYYLPANISSVHQGEDYITAGDITFKSTVVIVDHLPHTKKRMREFWGNNKRYLLNKYKPFESEMDRMVFIRNVPEEPYNINELRYWKGDHQYCFNGKLGGKCISKDEVKFIVIGNYMGGESEIIDAENSHPLYMWFLNR